MRRIVVLLFAAALLLVPSAAFAEGETVQVVSVDCDGIIVRGGGYTPGQDLLTFARAPQGEGTITNQVTVKANADGMMPSTTLKFGGQVPDGTYHAIITTPGGEPGMKEEVTARFPVSGCGPGSDGGPSGGVDDQNCSDFPSQARAQEHLDADRSDPDNLDTDDDGIACELGGFRTETTTPPTTPDQGGTLPFTGASSTPLLAAGALLLAAGAFLVRWGRRPAQR